MSAPVDGVRIIVTRSADQAPALIARLSALGAIPIELNTIAIAEPTDGGTGLGSALARMTEFEQIAVASPNAARSLLAAWGPAGSTELAPVACVGPATAAVFAGSAFVVNVVAHRSLAEGLVDALGPPPGSANRLLLVQPARSRDALVDGLRANGWVVERTIGYRTVDGQVDQEAIAAAAEADVITFTSSSTVERFVRLVGRDAVPDVVASIGPMTSATARDLGLDVSIEADPHTLDGLIDALVAWAAG